MVTATHNMHTIHCHFGESSKLESSDLQTHPPEALEDRSSAKSTDGSVPSHLRHGRGGVGPSGITYDRNLPSRDNHSVGPHASA